MVDFKNVSQETAKDFIQLVNEAKGFVKNGEAGFNNRKYKWILLDDLLEHVKNNENFAFIQPLSNDENGKPSLNNILIHKSGEVIQSGLLSIGYKEDDSNQNKGIAITYMRRYSLGAFLGVASETDNDGQPDEGKDLIDKASQKKVTKLFETMLTMLGTKDDVYKEIGTTRDEFLIQFNSKPKALIKPMEVWLKKNNVE